MMESVHRLGSSIRNSRLLKQQRWLWDLVEPAWQGLFAAASRKKGFAARVNADTFRLSYEYAARYDRADRQAYEPDFYAPFVASIKPGMTVLDVGPTSASSPSVRPRAWDLGARSSPSRPRPRRPGRWSSTSR